MHVLITDDMHTNRVQMGMVLKGFGCSYDEACNGEEAIAMIEQKDYDLVLMDIEMPVRNGIEAVEHIRKNKSGPTKGKLPVIAVTANETAELASNYKKHGFDGLIIKPINNDKINSYLKSSR